MNVEKEVEKWMNRVAVTMLLTITEWENQIPGKLARLGCRLVTVNPVCNRVAFSPSHIRQSDSFSIDVYTTPTVAVPNQPCTRVPCEFRFGLTSEQQQCCDYKSMRPEWHRGTRRNFWPPSSAISKVACYPPAGYGNEKTVAVQLDTTSANGIKKFSRRKIFSVLWSTPRAGGFSILSLWIHVTLTLMYGRKPIVCNGKNQIIF